MANNVLDNLGNVLSQQFGIGDNKVQSLNLVQNGQTQYLGKLGDFAGTIDPTAQRSYTEEGFFNTNYYNPKPKTLDILMQEPDITVLVKKRAFSSLAENFRTDLMDQTEQLFFKATKILFQNKCKQISAFEKLSKINQVSTDIGRVDYHLLPILFSAVDSLNQVPGVASSIPGLSGLTGIQSSFSASLSKFSAIVDRVREVVAMSQDNAYTTWITNIPSSFSSTFNTGTGVIEFTNITSLNTTSTLQFAAGRFDLNFSDPYELMLITNNDIEKAISDATNKFYNNSFVQLGINSLDQTISFQKQQLNQIRASRNVNPIIFMVEPNTLLGKNVRAIIDNIGFEINFVASTFSTFSNSTTIDPSALFGSSEIGSQGLTPNEITIFNNIVSSLYNQISTSLNTRRQALADNQDPTKNLNSVRKKLRLHYRNKLIIQPMDNVHIYIDSKKQIDTKVIGGLQSSFAGMGFMQGLNNLAQGAADSFQDVKNAFGNTNSSTLEKSIFVGNDFPNWLWLAMRSLFVSDRNGAHVFAGVVEKASSSWSNGSFTVAVNGSDNAAYFKYGIVNFKPSMEVFNGPLFDPLTPFKLDFDSVSGLPITQSPDLLDENKILFGSAFIKNKNGIYAGITPTENNFLIDGSDAERLKNNNLTKAYYDIDGMVYRWKEGISSLVFQGDTYNSDPNLSPAHAITDDEFAGQDIMNALSLLVTGEPYNYTTFYQTAIKFDKFKRDDATNSAPSKSYYRGLQNQLKERNLLYGDFVPFKLPVVDDATFAQITNNQLNAVAFDGDLQNLIQQRAALADQLSLFGKSQIFSTDAKGNPTINPISAAISNIDTQIQSKINSIKNALTRTGNPPITIVGNDISFDYDSSGLNQGSKTDLTNTNQRRDLRRKIAFLTRRLAWKVRANEDVNLCIVDDTYDKDYDIQAFATTIATDIKQFYSEYLTVADKIQTVMNAFQGFELFCNTQGHIEIRIPKYNRVPSSVFQRMLQMKNELGVQIYPQFLEDLFVNQINTMFDQIGILEDEIRLYCLALGYADDTSCANFINSTSTSLIGIVKTSSFTFLSDPNNGTVNNFFQSTILLSQPDQLTSYIQTKLSSFQQQSSVSVLSVISRAGIIQAAASSVPGVVNNSTQFTNLQQLSSISQDDINQRKNSILNRLQSKTSQTFDFTQITGNSSTMIAKSSTTILQITNSLAGYISSRQIAIKNAVNAMRNVQEGLTLTKSSGGPGNQSGANNLLYPNLYGLKNIPQSLEHMIEDESYDDLGIGSSGRYIIKNHDIINYTLEENAPPFNYIEVTGRIDLTVLNSDLAPDMQSITYQKGNGFMTASAIDYDLVRMYGLRSSQSVDAPFLSNPTTQCAPYATSLLNKARKEIFGGNISIVGNEYQQPGEVIYLENRDMLFYVQSVSHHFSYGESFTTSMNVGYGHNPGEYIPTFLDVVGKNLYKNKDNSYFVNKKQGNVFNQQYLGSIVGAAIKSSTTFQDSDITNGPYGQTNRLTLQTIIDQAGTTFGITSPTVKPVLEIRIYYNSNISTFGSPSPYAKSMQQSVMKFLTGASALSMNTNPVGNTTANNNTLSAFTQNKQIVLQTVNSNPKIAGEFRSPSAKSYYFARDIVNKNQSGTVNNNQTQIDTAIYNNIVDCWIVFQNPNS